MRQTIVMVSGTRADFGKLKPLAEALDRAKYEVTFFVTGMHMREKYGLTKFEVHNSNICEVFEFMNHREGDTQDVVIAKTIIGFSDFLHETKPDLVILHGDRPEAVAASIVCVTNKTKCLHIEGGEVSGTIDEQFRHCISKLATAHLVCSASAAKRLRRLGEPIERIHKIGSPEIDIHSQQPQVVLEDVLSYYHINNSDYGIAIFHPVTSEDQTIQRQAQELFKGLEASGRFFVLILPNNDPGHEKVFQVICDLSDKSFRQIPSMRFEYFSVLLKNSKCVVGNSSTGVREAPFLGIPSLNVGTRQNARSSAASITNCSAFDRKSILLFLEKMWGVTFPSDPEFGDGTASENFKQILDSQSIWNLPEQKYFQD